MFKIKINDNIETLGLINLFLRFWTRKIVLSSTSTKSPTHIPSDLILSTPRARQSINLLSFTIDFALAITLPPLFKNAFTFSVISSEMPATSGKMSNL